MTLLLGVFFVITTQVCEVVVSCPTDQELGVCDGGGLVPQNYCPGVDYNVKKWTCKSRKKIKCVCKAPFWRRLDGKCVLEENCGSPQRIIPKASEPPKVESSKVIKFLQNHDDIHLQMMPEDEWMKMTCECVKSRFMATHPDGCERTLDCYKPVKVLQAPPTIQASIGRDRLIMTTNLVDFEVTEDGSIYIDIWMIYEIRPTSNSPIQFPHTYKVEHAEENCLLLTYDYSSSGSSNCLLWGLSRANVDNMTECYKKIESSCKEKMYDLTEPDDQCEKLDEYEKRTEEKIRREQELEIKSGK